MIKKKVSFESRNGSKALIGNVLDSQKNVWGSQY